MDNQFNDKLADAFELLATILRTLGDMEPEPVEPDPEPEPDTSAWPSEFDLPYWEPQSEDPECLVVARQAGCFDKSLVTETVGGLTIKEDGAVIENLRILGPVTIKAHDVTIRNCIIDCSNRAGFEVVGQWYCVKNTDNGGYEGLLVEDCELVGSASSGVYARKGTFRRLNVYEHAGDGMKIAGPAIVEECWVHHIGFKDGSHADAVQMQDSGSGSTFRRNYMDLPYYDSVYYHGQPYKSNACFMIQTKSATEDLTDILIEDNWLRGGNYTLYFTRKSTSEAVVRDCTVRGNKLSWAGGRDIEKRRTLGIQTHISVSEGCGPIRLQGNSWYELAGDDQEFTNRVFGG